MNVPEFFPDFLDDFPIVGLVASGFKLVTLFIIPPLGLKRGHNHVLRSRTSHRIVLKAKWRKRFGDGFPVLTHPRFTPGRKWITRDLKITNFSNCFAQRWKEAFMPFMFHRLKCQLRPERSDAESETREQMAIIMAKNGHILNSDGHDCSICSCSTHISSINHSRLRPRVSTLLCGDFRCFFNLLPWGQLKWKEANHL